MIYALDANTISFILRPNRNPEVAREFDEIIKQGHNYIIPAISYFEVYWHLLRKKATSQLMLFQKMYNKSMRELSISENDIFIAAKIKVDLLEKNITLGKNDADVLIAAECIANDYTLVTDNVSDFQRIDGLKFVNWKSRD